MGRVGWVSGTGRRSGGPYTAADDAYTTRGARPRGGRGRGPRARPPRRSRGRANQSPFIRFLLLLASLPGNGNMPISGRSAVRLARLVRDQEVGGSNPLAPTAEE